MPVLIVVGGVEIDQADRVLLRLQCLVQDSSRFYGGDLLSVGTITDDHSRGIDDSAMHDDPMVTSLGRHEQVPQFSSLRSSSSSSAVFSLPTWPVHGDRWRDSQY